ncbi:MAG: hypothetical protein FWG64_11430 [Firmicutes bacterium]|nr:hypothetical protein [Bacillota bacterium]
MKKLMFAAFALLLFAGFSFTDDLSPFPIQDIYTPLGMLGSGLNNPSGIFIDRHDRIFLADRNNNRIVQLNRAGEIVQEISETLNQPEGVFVADNGDIFVADTGNRRIVRFDSNGEYIFSFGQPDDIRLQNTMFIPMQVAMDLRGNLYVLLLGSNEGIMVMSQDGEFLGFFGRNQTPLTFTERLLRFIYTEEQIRTNLNRVAPSPSALAVAQDGFIYTATQATDSGQLKKLNVNSEDMFVNRNFQVSQFNPMALSALTVSDSGVIFATDRNNGLVYIYNSNGELLAAFGELLTGGNFRVGVFGDPVGIAVNSQYELFVVDRTYNSIHVFSPTDLMLNLVAGTQMNLAGRHDYAEQNWNNVLRENSFIQVANSGLGRVYHRRGDYLTAMQFMRRAVNQELYSEARWQQRIIVIRQYFGIFAAVLAILAAFWLIFAKILRLQIVWVKNTTNVENSQNKNAGQGRAILLPTGQNSALRVWERPGFYGLKNFASALNVLKSPSDTFYGCEKNGGVFVAIAWLVVYLLAAFFAMGLTNFAFNATGLNGFSLGNFLAVNLLPIPIWVIAGYLVGTITKGQGKFSSIFVSTVYALMPLTIFRVPLAIISQALTLAEVSIYLMLQGIMWIWVVILQFSAIREVQGYFAGETIKNTAWMLFVSAMMIVFAVALYGVALQSYSFLDEFVRELIGLV